MANTVGLFRAPVAEAGQPTGANDELVGKLMKLFIEVRADARKNKNFATADGIRKGLTAIGVVLEDRPDGTSGPCRSSVSDMHERVESSISS